MVASDVSLLGQKYLICNLARDRQILSNIEKCSLSNYIPNRKFMAIISRECG